MCYCPAYKDNLAQKNFEKTTWKISGYYSNVPVLRYKKTRFTRQCISVRNTKHRSIFFQVESNSRRKMQLYAVQYSTTGAPCSECAELFVCVHVRHCGGEKEKEGVRFVPRKVFFFKNNPTLTTNQSWKTKPKHQTPPVHTRSRTRLRLWGQSYTHTTRILRQWALCLPPSVLWGPAERGQTMKQVR